MRSINLLNKIKLCSLPNPHKAKRKYKFKDKKLTWKIRMKEVLDIFRAQKLKIKVILRLLKMQRIL
jgi:hypothetical protein